MAEEVRLWQIAAKDALDECVRHPLDLEARLEQWIAKDVSVLDPRLMVIGRQVETDSGGFIDLLCLSKVGDLVVVELKRDKTPREITAQVLDYASWVKDLDSRRIREIADAYLRQDGPLDEAYRRRFACELPDTLNEDHSMLVVGSEIDASSERIITYLSSTYGVSINAATFQVFRSSADAEFLARVFLIEPEQVDYQTKTKGSSKRLPNLTAEQLAEIATSNGVGDLYRRCVGALEDRYQAGTTRTSIAFKAPFNGRTHTVFSLIPENSSEQKGLRFQAYTIRLASVLGIPQEDVVSLLPPSKEPWTYYEGAPVDYSGHAGFFRTPEEVETFISGLKSKRRPAGDGT
jgi:hypothetical protein